MSPLPARHLRRSRLIDRIVAAAITGGGAVVVVAVAFLLVFLVLQASPLLRTGSARAEGQALAGAHALAALEDEYRETVTVAASDGTLRFVPRQGAATVEVLEGLKPPVVQARVDASGTLLAVIDADASLGVWSLRTRVRWEGKRRVLEPALASVLHAPVVTGRLLAVSGDSENVTVILGDEDGARALSGSGTSVTARLLRLGAPASVGAVNRDRSEIWLASEHELALFALESGDSAPAEPVALVPLAAPATAAALVLGDVTCLIGDARGDVTAWQVVNGAVADSRVLDRAAVFRGHGRVTGVAPSQRDKTFAVVREGGRVELAHLTTRRVMLEVPQVASDLAVFGISPRRDGLFAVTRTGAVQRWSLTLPHPDVSLATLFLPVRYESYTKPELVWQSTGATEEAEAKLSLVPLIVGTLKGALYALLFSGPLALAAALYVSQFAPARLRLVAKPAVELMAALPSVVVGFFAALLLAPLLQHHLVGALAAMALLPLAIIAAAVLWHLLPRAFRRRLTPSREMFGLAGLAAAVVATGLVLQGALEHAFFGGDFTHWLLTAAGITYDQRNAVVVGFALGFAVIPIIFTLAEDAFSNVPASLISASLALGATPWQAARTVAIPAASPGLFAAVMTGLGRAVGETMIVLMATGNTPLLSFSPFNGMRTLSANIAVELPEAPYGGTLYRVLILTALLLFLFTFVINTVAVTVSNRLRKRFGRLAA
jgi:phosphate transport system permease protein